MILVGKEKWLLRGGITCATIHTIIGSLSCPWYFEVSLIVGNALINASGFLRNTIASATKIPTWKQFHFNQFRHVILKPCTILYQNNMCVYVVYMSSVTYVIIGLLGEFLVGLHSMSSCFKSCISYGLSTVSYMKLRTYKKDTVSR